MNTRRNPQTRQRRRVDDHETEARDKSDSSRDRGDPSGADDDRTRDRSDSSGGHGDRTAREGNDSSGGRSDRTAREGKHSSGGRSDRTAREGGDPLGAGDPARDRGRSAEHPKDIPAPGWRDILLRVWDRLGRDNVSLVAAGIAQNTLLAVFPALAVIVSVYGMFSSPADVANDMRPFFAILPSDAAKLLTLQLQHIASPSNGALGFGAVVSTLVALWSARQGMAAIMTATNIAYHQRERRSFFKQVAISIVFTLGAVLGFLVMLVLGVAVPLALKVLPLGPIASAAVLISRWILLWVFAVLGLAVIYRYAPDREDAQWRWVTWGSAMAATLWLSGSLLFALYVQNFGSYGKTYGALGGVIVLLLWFYVTAFVIVLGAVINAEMEHQTAVDTTSGPPAPMGERGAYVADTLGPTPK